MGKTCYITIRDEVYCHITGLAPSENEFLWNKFGIHTEGYFWAPAYKLGRWDGKIRFFEKTGKTYIRLLDQILPFIEKWGYEFALQDERKLDGLENIALIDENVFNLDNIKLRPYQVDAVNEAIEASSGFVIAGTGSGKSLMLAGLCYAYGRAGLRTITIVPSSDLVSQTAKWYEVLGLDVGEYSGDKKELDKQHVVATWQSLQNNPGVMSLFNVVAVDESHGAKASVIQKLINEHGKHIRYRFGFTGTFPKPEVDRFSLMSSIGPILTEIPARWLIDNGYLAEIEIETIRTEQKMYEDGDFPDYQSERAFLSKSEERLDAIADLVIAACEKYGNTLVLVSSIDFGERLSSLIKDSSFLYGMTEKDERKMHYDAFEQENGVIKIATSGIASTGISIDRVFCLILIDSGKSFIRAIQSVGRGTRLSADKNKVHVIDIGADLKWSRKHMNERIKYYKEAQYPHSKPRTVKV